ncbi:MAG: LuxR family transcriptional regulator [Ignavibacteriaceae bacterium]
MTEQKLTGRTKEKNSLYQIYDAAKNGNGKLVLISGEAGVGKTALVEETLAYSGLKVYTFRCSEEGTPPYGPIVSILRSCLRESDKKEIDCGPLTKYLPHLLPELGNKAESADADTLKEAIISALFTIASEIPTAFFIDDLHWADDATLDLLASFSDNLNSKNLVIICTYRTDDDTGLKKFRNELRRRRKLNELVIGPLDYSDTKNLLLQSLKKEPSDDLIEKIFNITQGIPLFIEELIESLVSGNNLREVNGKISLPDKAEIPLPYNLRQAVLHHLERLSDEARNKLEICAIAGIEFNPDIIVRISGNDEGLDELLVKKILREISPDTLMFRHTLIREAVKSQIIWSRRRFIHRQIAEHYTVLKSHPDIIAAHWFAANETEKAIHEYLRSAELSCRVYAYSDAARALNKALSLWNENNDPEKKTEVLFLYAKCSQMSGNLSESVKALKQITENYPDSIENNELAEAYRILANVYALQGSGELSALARLKAAELFYLSGQVKDSASELLIAAGRYTALLKLEQAYDLAVKSAEYAAEVKDLEIETQALALTGNILAMQGKINEGKKIVENALSVAIKNNLSDAASIIYRRLASILEYASDYNSAREAYYSAYNYCITEGKEVSAQICLGCMSNTLFMTGDWKKSLEVCDEVINNKNTPGGSMAVGLVIKGFILALRGEFKKADRVLNQALTYSRKYDVIAAEIGCLWGFALLSEADADIDKAMSFYCSVFELWHKTQDRHDSIIVLIWAAYFFSEHSFEKELTRCTEALAVISSATGNPEALAGLAFALGETSLVNKSYQQAADKFDQALSHLELLQMPLLKMLVYVRIAVVNRLNKDPLNAKKFLFSAQSISKNLGTRPFSVKIEEQLRLLGVEPGESRKENSDERSGRIGLTRRQYEILELLTEGLTNKEIADKLFLSTRTVDMHVSHILERLNCRTRIDAINKARELNLIR